MDDDDAPPSDSAGLATFIIAPAPRRLAPRIRRWTAGANDAITAIQRDHRACVRCVDAGYLPRAHPVFSGAAGQRIMLVGQAPGPVEDDVDRPFAGRAGAQLMRWFTQAGFAGEDEVRDRVFMTSMTTCFPGRLPSNAGDRRPSAAEVALCSGWLDAYIELLRPALIICIGGLAHSRFLPGRRLDSSSAARGLGGGEIVEGVPSRTPCTAAVCHTRPARAAGSTTPSTCGFSSSALGAPGRLAAWAESPATRGDMRVRTGERGDRAGRCYDPRAVFGFATKVIQAVPETDAAPLRGAGACPQGRRGHPRAHLHAASQGEPGRAGGAGAAPSQAADLLRDQQQNFYWRQHITKFVLDEGGVPISPFMLFDYYLLHTVPKETVREAFNNLIVRCDQMWVFGNLSLGVKVQIGIAKRLRKPLRFYDITDMPYRVVSVPEAMLREE